MSTLTKTAATAQTTNPLQKVTWFPYDLMSCDRVKGFNPTNAFEFGCSTGRSYSPVACRLPENPELKIVGVSFYILASKTEKIRVFRVRLNQGAVFQLVLQVDEGKKLLDRINRRDVTWDYLKNLEDLTFKSWKIIGEDMLGNVQWKAR